jgi:Protein of unknown function (DUF1573)
MQKPEGRRREMMKTAIAALLLTFLCAGLLTAQEYKGPRIEVKELRYDFGKVVQGTVVSHVFEVRNAGNETLEIEHIQPA